MATYTSHYEFYSERDDMMIYGIKVQEIFNNTEYISENTSKEIDSKIQDILQKVDQCKFSKKGIVLYSSVKEVFHIRYLQFLWA